MSETVASIQQMHNNARINDYLDYSRRDDVLSDSVKMILVDTLKVTFRVWMD
jgi:hypothetical protein